MIVSYPAVARYIACLDNGTRIARLIVSMLSTCGMLVILAHRS